LTFFPSLALNVSIMFFCLTTSHTTSYSSTFPLFLFLFLWSTSSNLDMEAISDAAHRVAALGPRTVVMLIVATVFLILTWISFALRVYVRAIMIRSFGKDDWTMLLTLCLFTTCCGLLISIERLEQSDRPRRVLEEGPLAQLDLLNHIMKVCRMPSFLFMLAN